MKKQQHSILLCVTGIFVAFTLGFFLGRSTNRSDVRLASVPEVTVTQAAEVSEPQTEAPAQTTAPETAAPPEASAPVETAPAQTEAPTKTDGLININTATRAELQTLPGIGEVLAQRIIDYREANGPFTDVSQLTYVSGIGEKRLAAIIDLITVG